MSENTMKLGKKKLEEIPEKQETPDEELVAYLGIQGYQVPEGFTQIESYSLNPPFSYAWVFQDDSEGGFFYVVDDLPMSKEERDSYKRLKNILEYELKAPRIDETLVDSFRRQLPTIIDLHKEALEGTSQVGLRKIIYYLEKDLIGYGKIDGLISDPNT
jgi:flagellar protein FlaI